WHNVLAKFNADGYPTDVIITDESVNPEKLNPADNSKLVVHIAFDPTTSKPVSYRIPNPNYNKDSLLARPTISLTRLNELTPAQQELITNADDAIIVINWSLYRCVGDKVKREVTAGIDPGSPAE